MRSFYEYDEARKYFAEGKQKDNNANEAQAQLQPDDLSVEEYLVNNPGGYFQIRRSGGLDLTSSLEAKFGARSGQVYKIGGKIWEVLSPKDAKVGKKSQFWGHI